MARHTNLYSIGVAIARDCAPLAPYLEHAVCIICVEAASIQVLPTSFTLSATPSNTITSTQDIMADDFSAFFDFDGFNSVPIMENYDGFSSMTNNDQQGFSSAASLQGDEVFDHSTVLSDETLNQLLDETLAQYGITPQQVSNDFGTAYNQMDSNSFSTDDYFGSNALGGTSWFIDGALPGQIAPIEELESFNFDELLNEDHQIPEINRNEQGGEQAFSSLSNASTPPAIYATFTHPQPMNTLNSGFTQPPIANLHAYLQHLGQYPPTAQGDLACLQAQGLSLSSFSQRPKTRPHAPPIIPEEDLQMIGQRQASACLSNTFTTSTAPPVVPDEDLLMIGKPFARRFQPCANPRRR